MGLLKLAYNGPNYSFTTVLLLERISGILLKLLMTSVSSFFVIFFMQTMDRALLNLTPKPRCFLHPGCSIAGSSPGSGWIRMPHLLR
jgi:hypothetical protein